MAAVLSFKFARVYSILGLLLLKRLASFGEKT